MNTSGWIKLIGILCIIFGAIGILNAISSLLLPELTEMAKEKVPEVSPDLLRWGVRLGYLGILVYSFYLMAGILFLLKKTFSLNMMYFALSISILFKIVPLLFLNRYGSTSIINYGFNLSNLLGPAIDMALLIGVYRIGKRYYKSPEELKELFGENKKRNTLTPRLLKILTFLGLFCLSIPLLILGLWIHAFDLGDSQTSRVAIFNSYFPDFLHRYDTAFLSGAFCILTIILSSISLTLSGKLWKTLNTLILISGSLLLLLNLFSMM